MNATIEAYRLDHKNKPVFKSWFQITVDNREAGAFNINIDLPTWGCFAWSEDEAMDKYKASDFAYKHRPIISINETKY